MLGMLNQHITGGVQTAIFKRRHQIPMLLDDITNNFHAGGQRAMNILLHRQLAVDRDHLGILGGFNQEHMESVVSLGVTHHIHKTPPRDKCRRGLCQPTESGQLLAGKPPHRQLDRPKLQRQPQVECVVHIQRSQRLFGRRRRCNAAAGKFLIVKIARRQPLRLKIIAHRIHHRRRATEIHINIAAVKLGSINMLGHVALVRIGALRVGYGAQIAEIRQPAGVVVKRLSRHEIFIAGHAKDKLDRMRGSPRFRERIQHREKRCQTGSTGQKQRRAFQRAQIEAAQWATQAKRIPGFGLRR